MHTLLCIYFIIYYKEAHNHFYILVEWPAQLNP